MSYFHPCKPQPAFARQLINAEDDSSLFYFYIKNTEIRAAKVNLDRSKITNLDQHRQVFLYKSEHNLPNAGTLAGYRSMDGMMSSLEFDHFLDEIKKIGFLNMLKLLDGETRLCIDRVRDGTLETLVNLNKRHIKVTGDGLLRRIRSSMGYRWRLQNNACVHDLQPFLLKNLNRKVEFESQPLAFIYPCHLLCIKDESNAAIDTTNFIQLYMKGVNPMRLRAEKIDFGTICLLQYNGGYWARVVTLSFIEQNLEVLKWRVICVDGKIGSELIVEASIDQLFALPDGLSLNNLPSLMFLAKLRALGGIKEGMIEYGQKALHSILKSSMNYRMIALPRKTAKKSRFLKNAELKIVDLIPEMEFALYPLPEVCSSSELSSPSLLSDLLISNDPFARIPVRQPMASEFWVFASNRLPPRPQPPMLLGFSQLNINTPIVPKNSNKPLYNNLHVSMLSMFIDPSFPEDFEASPILQFSPFWLCFDESNKAPNKSLLVEKQMKRLLLHNTIVQRQKIANGNLMLLYEPNGLIMGRVLIISAFQSAGDKVTKWLVLDVDKRRPQGGDIFQKVKSDLLYSLPKSLRLPKLPCRLFLARVSNSEIVESRFNKAHGLIENAQPYSKLFAKRCDHGLHKQPKNGVELSFRDVPELDFYNTKNEQTSGSECLSQPFDDK